MSFTPTFCPCRSHDSFQYQRRGSFVRACDGRRIQRFQCKQCNRSFSTQTFSGDYRLKRPELNERVFLALISKVTQRQIARTLRCKRRLVMHRLERFGEQCRAFHAAHVKAAERSLVPGGVFLLDELETYEHNRRLRPLTVPVLVHKPSHCVLHTAVGTLPARRPLKPAEQAKLAKQESACGKRRSQSRVKVDECFQVLSRLVPGTASVVVRTDQKHSYAKLLRERFGERLVHKTTHSKEPRTYSNPLFVVNHTLAMLRDGIGRLVRRNWGATKRQERLEQHLWIWIAWRNYVRPITNQNHDATPGMVAGLCQRMLDVADLIALRVLRLGDAQSRGPKSPSAS